MRQWYSGRDVTVNYARLNVLARKGLLFLIPSFCSHLFSFARGCGYARLANNALLKHRWQTHQVSWSAFHHHWIHSKSSSYPRNFYSGCCLGSPTDITYFYTTLPLAQSPFVVIFRIYCHTNLHTTVCCNPNAWS